MPRKVGSYPGIEKRQGCADRVRHVVANERASRAMRFRQEGHKRSTDDSRSDETDNVDAPRVSSSRHIGCRKDRDDIYRASGDREERGLSGVVAEAVSMLDRS